MTKNGTWREAWLMKRLALVALALPVAAIAQTVQIPQDVMSGLARDLAALQREVLDVQAQQKGPADKYANIGLLRVTEPTYLRAGAGDKAATLRQVKPGELFPVISQVGDWYAVRMATPYEGLNTAWLKAAAAVPVPDDARSTGSAGDAIFVRLTESAARLRESYRSNPYVNVTGFAVNVVPPSVSINFEFKK